MKMSGKDLYLILGALVGRAHPKLWKIRFTKFGRLTGRHLMEGAKIILFICLLNLF